MMGEMEGARGVGNNVQLDAIPYVDVEYNDPAVKQYVDKLVNDELKKMKVSKLHPSVGPVPARSDFEKSWFLKTEQRRVELGHPMKPLDLSRYALPGPKQDQGWEEAIANAMAQNEMQSGRLMNLEILNQFGQNKWKRSTELVDAMQKQVADALAAVQEQIQEVNGERRTTQAEAGRRLHELENEWRELTRRNYEIECAIQDLKAKPANKVMQ